MTAGLVFLWFVVGGMTALIADDGDDDQRVDDIIDGFREFVFLALLGPLAIAFVLVWHRRRRL